MTVRGDLLRRQRDLFDTTGFGQNEAVSLMKARAAACAAARRVGFTSSARMLPETSIARITVTELSENTFFAQITVVQDGQEIEIDARPSDAIALAIRTEAPIFAADDVIAESAIEFEGEEVDEEQLEAEVLKFRSFLEDVTPDQFVVENGDEED